MGIKTEIERLIVPAIIAKTQGELDEMLERVKMRVKRVQLDVMDGKFVPNTSLNFDFELPEGFEYEAHLMVINPLTWVEENSRKVDIVTLHAETLKNVGEAVNYAKSKGVRVNLALIPETEVEAVQAYLGQVDGVLLMTVRPGSYCKKKEFHAEPLKKIGQLRSLRRDIPVEVDGCMNPQNARLAKDYGATVFVSGSHIFKSRDVKTAIEELKDAVA